MAIFYAFRKLPKNKSYTKRRCFDLFRTSPFMVTCQLSPVIILQKLTCKQ